MGFIGGFWLENGSGVELRTGEREEGENEQEEEKKEPAAAYPGANAFAASVSRKRAGPER